MMSSYKVHKFFDHTQQETNDVLILEAFTVYPEQDHARFLHLFAEFPDLKQLRCGRFISHTGKQFLGREKKVLKAQTFSETQLSKCSGFTTSETYTRKELVTYLSSLVPYDISRYLNMGV